MKVTATTNKAVAIISAGHFNGLRKIANLLNFSISIGSDFVPFKQRPAGFTLMISVAPQIQLDENELTFRFILASGPGGQNVNKVATAAQLRFDVVNSPTLPEEVRGRLIRLAGKRMTKEGELVLTAKRFRTQERNRQEAIDRLIALIQKAAEAPKPRRQTKPSRAAKQRRLEAKQRRGKRKLARRPVKIEPD